MTDQEGLISLLQDCTPLEPIKEPPVAPVPRKGDLSVLVCDVDDWQNASVPEKYDKIQAVVMNSKSAEEVATEVRGMSVPVWLDLVIKMAPKNVKVSGAVSFKHMIDNLAPIDKDQYKFNAVEVEYSEIK